MAMLATFRNAAGSSRATYTPWVTSSAAAAAGGAVEDGNGAASFATPSSIASLSFIPSHDVAAECPVPARAWGHKPDRATTNTSSSNSSAAATSGFRSFNDEGDPPCSPSAYPNAFGGASHGSAMPNSQATRAVLYGGDGGGGGGGNFNTQQQQQWNGELLESQRQPHRTLAMATPGPIAMGSGVFGDHLSSSNRYSFDALISSPSSRRFDPVAASTAAADIDGASWIGSGGGGGSGQQFPPASLQQQQQAAGAFVIRAPSIVASTRFSRMDLGQNQQAMSQQWSHEELQRQMKEEHQLLQQSLARQWHQQQHEQLQQQQQPAGFTRQLPSPSVALLLASSHDPDLLSSSPSTGPGLCPIPACDWRGADASARGGGGGSSSTVRASRLSALQGGERNESGGEVLGQKGGDHGAISTGSNSSGNSCSGGSSNSSSSNSGSLGSGTWPPVGALAAQGARVLSKTGSSYLDGTGGSGSGSSGYSTAVMGNTSSRFFRQQQQQQQQQQRQEQEDEQQQSRIPSLHQQQQLQLQQQAAGVRGSASGPMKLLRPHSAATGSGSNSSGLSSMAFPQGHLLRATSGPPPVEEDEWEEHMHMEEQDQVYHPSRLQHVYAGDSVQQGADCINWKDVEEVCASMDRAGVQLEDICLLCLPPGRSALAPSKASKEDVLGGSSKAACESVLMKLRFRGMSMWHYPGDQTTKQLFQEVIRANSGAEA